MDDQRGAVAVRELEAPARPAHARASGPRKRVLIYGLHGYRNLGAESRLVAMVHRLRQMVPDAEVITNSLDRTALDYLDGNATVRYFHPAAYRNGGRRLIADSDVMILSEGVFITERFSPHMVTAMVSAIEHANRVGAASVGMALDSGYLSPRRAARAAKALNDMALLTLRCHGAKDELRGYGVKVPMSVTSDCAVSMPLPDEATRRDMRDRLGLGDGPVHAIAPVDFFMWPLRIRPLARRRDFVRWPFKRTFPDGGRARSRELVEQWAEYSRYLLSTDPGARVLIVTMEKGDNQIAGQIQRAIGRPERVSALNGQRFDPQQISAALSNVTSMTSSRYHGNVLGLAHSVPYLALGHDNRTRFLSDELGLPRSFLEHSTPDLVATMRERHEELMANRDQVREKIATGFLDMQRRERDNWTLLAPILEQRGYAVEEPA